MSTKRLGHRVEHSARARTLRTALVEMSKFLGLFSTWSAQLCTFLQRSLLWLNPLAAVHNFHLCPCIVTPLRCSALFFLISSPRQLPHEAQTIPHLNCMAYCHPSDLVHGQIAPCRILSLEHDVPGACSSEMLRQCLEKLLGSINLEVMRMGTYVLRVPDEGNPIEATFPLWSQSFR